MRLGYFSDTYLPTMHGVTTSIRDFGEELVKRGHKIFLYAPDCDREYDKGMKVYSCKGVDFKPYPGFRSGFALQMKIPELDLIHAQSPANLGWYALKIGDKRNLPVVYTYHTLLPDYAKYLFPFAPNIGSWIIVQYLKFFINRCDGVIAPSIAIKNLIPDVKPPVEVIPSGVNLQRFQRVENARDQLGIKCRGRFFLSLCRLGYEKRIDVIIKAAKKVMEEKDRLYVVGKGPEMNNLKKIAGDDKRIVFTGYIPDEDVASYYSAADFYILASDTETQGLTPLEAMACGVPVIAANAMANPEQILDGKNGYLFKANDVDDLARVMNRAENTEHLVRGALKMADERSVVRQTDQLEKYYEGFMK